MKSKTLLFAALMLAVSGARAAGVGTTGASFLKVGVGARQLAMGSAGAALVDDANAIYWNPAMLGGMQGKNLTASYNSLFLDESQGFLGYAAPFKEMGVVGVGVNYLTVSDIEKRATDSDLADSKFSNNNTAVSFSYGRAEVRPNLAVGGSLKYIQQKLDTHSDKAIAFDLGSSYKVNSDWTMAFVVQNLGTKIGPDSLPLILKGGAATKALDKKLSLASDLDWLASDKRFYLSLGAEYALNQNLAFRAGYQAGRSSDDLGGLTGLGAGLGLKFDKFAFDYAYVPFGDLGDTHRVTLGYGF